MSDQRERISFSDLPPRPRALTDSELNRVFGGACSNSYCRRDEDCCMRKCHVIPLSQPAVYSCRPIG